MTVIAGVAHQGRVYLAADSCWSSTYMVATQSRPKVRRVREDVVIGTTGVVRFSDVVLTKLDMSGCPAAEDIDYWIADTARRLCADNGVSLNRDGQNYDVGEIVVGHRGQLSRIDSNFGVLRTRAAYIAAGSGAETANGAMWTATRAPNWSPREVLRAAVRAAAAHCPSVRGPFRFVSTEST